MCIILNTSTRRECGRRSAGAYRGGVEKPHEKLIHFELLAFVLTTLFVCSRCSLSLFFFFHYICCPRMFSWSPLWCLHAPLLHVFSRPEWLKFTQQKSYMWERQRVEPEHLECMAARGWRTDSEMEESIRLDFSRHHGKSHLPKKKV